MINLESYMLISIFALLMFLVMLFLYMQQKSVLVRLSAELLEYIEDKERSAQEIKELSNSNNNLQIQYAILNTRYEEEIQNTSDKLAILQNTKESLSKEFSLLANQIFEDKTKQFSSASKEQLELLLQPFREQISSFSQEVKSQHEKSTKERFLLKDELSRLQELNQQLSNDAINLTNALKGENKVQGNWGEMVLENILEHSGLRKGIEYELQATLHSLEGKMYRPDVILHMPDKRDIVIDAKVSLVAYERYVNLQESKAKKLALQEHMRSVETHIKELSKKNYEALEGLHSLDFVLLFMPIEGAFLTVQQEESRFFKNAFEKNILLVSPSTLLVTLRTIEHIWRIQHQEEHAQKIAGEAQAMYEKFTSFVDEMQKIGVGLHKTQQSYEIAMNRLKSGRGNLIKRAENIVELGVKPKKMLNLQSEEG